MTQPPSQADRRWPRRVYGVGAEPDPRFSFANERTFLAWVRTSLGFLAAGVALAAITRLNAALSVPVRVAALLLVACGLVCGVGAFSRWMRNERALRLGQPLPASPAMPIVTGIVVVIALAAFVVVSLS